MSENFRQEEEVRAEEADEENIIERTLTEIDPGTGVKRESKIKTFCNCGRQIDKEKAKKCSNCGNLICGDCEVSMEKKIICENCLRNEIADLSRDQYKALLLLDKDLSLTEISQMVNIRKDSLRDILQEVEELWDRKDSYLGFKEMWCLTPEGEMVVDLYEQIYGDEAEVQDLKEEVKVNEVLR